MPSLYSTHQINTAGLTGTTTTLNGNITSSATTIVVTSGAAIIDGTVISIGSEHLFVSAGGGTTSLTVVRGWAGTAAASASSGATVNVPAGWLFNLLQIQPNSTNEGVPNQDFVITKISTDINYVKIVPNVADVLQGGAAAIILADASANYGTTRIKAPGVGHGNMWIQTAGAGAAGSGSGGGGGSAAGVDTDVQINVTGNLGADNNLQWLYSTGGGLIAGGTGTTNASKFTRDIASYSVPSLQSCMTMGLTGTGSKTVGIGPSMLFFNENSAGSLSYLGRFGALWVNSTAGSEQGSIVFTVRANSADAFAETYALSFAPTTDATFYGNLLPNGNFTQNLGSASSLFWNNAFIGQVTTEGIVLVYGGAAKAAIGWDNTNGAVAITNNIAQVLFEFLDAGQNVSYWDLVPNITNTHNLGTSSLYWNNAYITNLTLGTSLTFTSSPFQSILNALAIVFQDPVGTTITSVAVGGFTTTTGNLNIGGNVVSNLVPSGTFNLGGSANWWTDSYIQTIITQAVFFDDATPTFQMKMGWDSADLSVSFVNNISQRLFEVFVGGGASSFGNFWPAASNSYNLGNYFNGVVNTSGTSVTWVSGATFISKMVGATININATAYTVATVPSSTSMTLTASAGTNSGVAYNLTFYWENAYITNLILGAALVLTVSPFQATYAAVGIALDDPPGTLIASLTVGGLTVYNSAGSTIVTKADSTSGLYTTLNLYVGGNVTASLVPSGSINLGSSSSWWDNSYIQNEQVQIINFYDAGPTKRMQVGWDSAHTTLAFIDYLSNLCFEIGIVGGPTTVYGNFIPAGNNSNSLGSPTLYWEYAYISTMYAPASSLQIIGNLALTGSVDAALLVSAGGALITATLFANLVNSTTGYETGGGTPVTIINSAGDWVGPTVAAAYGGTGQTTYTNGDLLVGNGSATLSRLAIGTNGYVLTADSTQTDGLAWEALPAVSLPAWTGWSLSVTGGFTGTPSTFQSYSQSNKTAFFSFQISGTANGSTIVVTLPSSATNAVGTTVHCIASYGGGAYIALCALLVLGSVLISSEASGSALPSGSVVLICSGSYQAL